MGELQTPVVGGHVYCRERHADTDVTVCVTCDRLRTLQEKSSPPYIVCRIDELELDAPDPRFVEWWFEHHRPSR